MDEQPLLEKLDSIKARIATVMASQHPEFRKIFLLGELRNEMRETGLLLQKVRDGPRIQAEIAKLDPSLQFNDMERQFFPPSESLKERMNGFALFKHLPTKKLYSCKSLTMTEWMPFELEEWEALEIDIYNDEQKQYQRNKEALQNL